MWRWYGFLGVVLFGILIRTGVRANPNLVSCTTLIRNAFSTDLVNDPILPVFTYEDIIISGGTGVLVHVNLTGAANGYGAGLDPTNNRTRYVAIPRPHCTIGVATTCVDATFLTIDTPNCAITDRLNSLIGTDHFGYYLFLPSGPEALGCDGQSFMVEFDGPRLSNTTNSSIYKVDFGGMVNGNTTDGIENLYAQYKTDTCPLEDGLSAGSFTGNVAQCTGRAMECAIPFSIGNPSFILDARPRCRVPNSNPRQTYWRVQRRLPYRSQIASVEYNVTFGDLIDPVLPGDTYPDELIRTDTRRQYRVDTNLDNMLQVGWMETAAPRFIFTDGIDTGFHEFLPPCVCNITIFCTSGGVIDLSADGIQFINPSAVPREGNATSLVQIDQAAGDTFTLTTPYLNSTGQPDLSLQYYWLPDPRFAEGPVLLTSGDGIEETFSVPGIVSTYSIYVYAFNGDDTSAIEVRVRIEEPQLLVVITASGIDVPVGTLVQLNATESVPQNLNPHIPPVTIVSIEWNQLSGYFTPLTDEHTLTPSFTTIAVGEAVYQLTLMDSLGRTDLGSILISTDDPLPPASGPPVDFDTNCTLAGGVCTASEKYCEFIGGIQTSRNCTSDTSADPTLPGLGDTFCCELVSASPPDAPVDGPIPDGPPGNTRPISPSPPPFVPLPPHARPLVPPSANQTTLDLGGLEEVLQEFLANLQREHEITTLEYIALTVILAVQLILVIIFWMYLLGSPEISAENTISYYALLEKEEDGETS